MTELPAELKKEFNRAKVGLMRKPDSAFVCTILFNLETIFTDELETAGISKFNLFVNPKYFMGLTADERVGLLFHEAWHPALNHIQRGKDLDRERYNWAGDYVINIMGVDAGYTLPQTDLIDEKYRGWSTRAVYDDLENKQEQMQQKVCSIGADLDFRDADDWTKEDEQKMTSMLVRASIAHKLQKGCGSLPSEIEVLIEELTNPILPWPVLLQDFMTELSKDDFSWRKANRRFLPYDLHLPSLYSPTIGELAIAVDSSGSVTNKEFTAFLVEIQAIRDVFKPDTMKILPFDTTIKDTFTLEPHQTVTDVVFTGRGGTNIREVWDWGKKHNPTALIIFSDMDFPHPTTPLACPVLWIAVNRYRDKSPMPFGRTIDIQI